MSHYPTANQQQQQQQQQAAFGNGAPLFLSAVSPPIPLAHYQPQLSAASLPPMHLLSAPPAITSSTSPSSSSFLSASAFAFPLSGREQPQQPHQKPQPSAPHSLSSSALDHQEVYRGMHFQQREPTMFQQQPSAANWQQKDYSAFVGAAPKKLDLPSLSASALPSPAGNTIDVPLVPSHVERFTSFYSHAVPAVIAKALRMAFRTISDMRVDVDCAEEARLAKFRGVCYSEEGDSIQFVARVWRSAASAPAPYLVELQRRCGDSVCFFRLYQKVVRACAHVHAAPFESSFMNRPAAASTGSFALSGPVCLPFPGAAGSVCLDGATLQSLCSMATSECVDTQREGAKCLGQVARQADLFDVPAPQPMQRASSLGYSAPQQADAPTDALWSALSTLLVSRDSDCARLGASILRSCLRGRSHSALLMSHLERDPSLLHHLVATLDADAADAEEESESAMAALCHRENQRQAAAVLAALAQRKGNAFLHSIAPNASALVQQFNCNA